MFLHVFLVSLPCSRFTGGRRQANTQDFPSVTEVRMKHPEKLQYQCRGGQLISLCLFHVCVWGYMWGVHVCGGTCVWYMCVVHVYGTHVCGTRVCGTRVGGICVGVTCGGYMCVGGTCVYAHPHVQRQPKLGVFLSHSPFYILKKVFPRIQRSLVG